MGLCNYGVEHKGGAREIMFPLDKPICRAFKSSYT